MAEIWIVDDDRSLRRVLEHALSSEGHQVRSYASAAEVLQAANAQRPDALFTDVRMDGMDGLSLLGRLNTLHPGLPVIVMSAYADLQGTVAAYHEGAFDFLAKPFDLDRALEMALRATQPSGTAAVEPSLQQQNELLGETEPMREVFRTIGRLSRSQLSVLITGETGTGKELVARALHRHSPRHKGAFVALNTAAIPSELLEAELFGHEQGAFTGAQRRHSGRFEQAEGGTLFLDEIGDMPAALQTRLLRVLAEGEFYRVGGRELIHVDVRVIAATHQDLEARVERGEFRADLLHRLDVVRLKLPPLRQRRDDITLLARHFVDRASEEMGLERKRLSKETLNWLRGFDWPGNVRQLDNLCRRLVVMAPGQEILPADLPAEIRQPGSSGAAEAGRWNDELASWARQALQAGEVELLPRARNELEQTLLNVALEFTGNHRQNAAKLLGCGRNTLTRKLA